MTTGSLWHWPATGSDAWIFIAGHSFLASVNAGAPPETVAALWDQATAVQPAIEDIVGTIPLDVTGGVHSFCVVSLTGSNEPGEAERTITAVVRGSAIVDVFSVGGSRRFAADSVQPWVLADFRSVTAVRLSGADRPVESAARATAGSLPSKSGVVQAERMLWSLAAGPAGSNTTAELDDDTLLGDTLLVSRSGSRLAPAPLVNDSDCVPGPALAAPLQFRLAGGESRPLDVPAIVGRDPRPPRVISGPAPVLVRVDSPQAVVSSTHLSLAQEGSAVVVTDLRSTNGTTVTPPGGPKLRLRPGESVVVLAGSRIDIGDGNIIEIMPANQAPEPDRSAYQTVRGPA